MDMRRKKLILDAVRKYLEEMKNDHFKTNPMGKDNPINIVEGSGNNEFEPDLTAQYKNSVHIYKIESGKDIEREKDKFIRKCKALQNYANSKKGQLHLIVPIEHFEKVLTEINKNNLENVGILQIDSL
jgi:hypothetical protein